MLITLENFLIEAEKRQLCCVRINELIRITDQIRIQYPSWRKRIITRLWFLYEKLFYSIFRLKTTSSKQPVVHFWIRPYRGKSIMLNDGTELKPHDLV